jgi:hypothetical protein
MTDGMSDVYEQSHMRVDGRTRMSIIQLRREVPEV